MIIGFDLGLQGTNGFDFLRLACSEVFEQQPDFHPEPKVFFSRFFGFLKITNVSGFLQKFKLYQVQCIRLTKKCIRFFYQVVKLYQGGKYQVFEIFDFLPG